MSSAAAPVGIGRALLQVAGVEHGRGQLGLRLLGGPHQRGELGRGRASVARREEGEPERRPHVVPPLFVETLVQALDEVPGTPSRKGAPGAVRRRPLSPGPRRDERGPVGHVGLATDRQAAQQPQRHGAGVANGEAEVGRHDDRVAERGGRLDAVDLHYGLAVQTTKTSSRVRESGVVGAPTRRLSNKRSFSTRGPEFKASRGRVLAGGQDGDEAAILDRLATFEQSAVDGSINELPSVRDQLRNYIAHRAPLNLQVAVRSGPGKERNVRLRSPPQPSAALENVSPKARRQGYIGARSAQCALSESAS